MIKNSIKNNFLPEPAVSAVEKMSLQGEPLYIAESCINI